VKDYLIMNIVYEENKKTLGKSIVENWENRKKKTLFNSL